MPPYLSITPASAQDDCDRPTGGSLILAYRCCRKWLTRLGALPPPNTAPAPAPRGCPGPPPHRPHATPPVGAPDESVSSLPTNSWYGRGPRGTRNSASINTPASRTPRHTTSQSPRNSVAESPPSPTATSRASNRPLGSSDADSGSRSPAPTTSGPYFDCARSTGLPQDSRGFRGLARRRGPLFRREKR